MKFSTSISALSVAALASATSVRYDAGYDDGSRSMTAVACSDGTNGLITRYGWQTQGQIPRFPYIGAADSIAGYNSGNCGQCLSVSYGGRTIYVVAIDHADTGLVLSTAAVNDLTNGQAVSLGVVDAQVESVDVSNCGLTPAKRFFRA